VSTEQSYSAGFSIGQVAAQLGQPVHRINYALDKSRLQPAGRVGILRLFTREQVEQIGRIITEVDRSPQSAPHRQARAAARAAGR